MTLYAQMLGVKMARLVVRRCPAIFCSAPHQVVPAVTGFLVMLVMSLGARDLLKSKIEEPKVAWKYAKAFSAPSPRILGVMEATLAFLALWGDQPAVIAG